LAWTVPGSSHTSTPLQRVAVAMLEAAVAISLFDRSDTTRRTFAPRRAAAMIRSIASGSVRYGFITWSRSRAPSICSSIAYEAATKLPPAA
jgi:hypothetical protein